MQFFELSTVDLKDFLQLTRRIQVAIDDLTARGFTPAGLVLDSVVKDLVLRGKGSSAFTSATLTHGTDAVKSVCGLPVERWSDEGPALIIAH